MKYLLAIEEQGLTTQLMKHLKLESSVENGGWKDMVARMKSTEEDGQTGNCWEIYQS